MPRNSKTRSSNTSRTQENLYLKLERIYYLEKKDRAFLELLDSSNEWSVNTSFGVQIVEKPYYRTSHLEVFEIKGIESPISDMHYKMQFLVDFSLPVKTGNRIIVLTEAGEKGKSGEIGFLEQANKNCVTIRNDRGTINIIRKNIKGIGKVTGYFDYHTFPDNGVLKNSNS